MIKVAVIGCGSIVKFRHGPEYASNPNVEMAGFYDPIIERAGEEGLAALKIIFACMESSQTGKRMKID